MRSTLLACLCLVMSVAISACGALPRSDLARDLIDQVERTHTCAADAHLGGWPRDEVWTWSSLREAARSQTTRQMLDDYRATLGNRAFTSRWPTDRALLVGRLLVDRTDATVSASAIASDIEVCVQTAMAVHPAAAWELRGRLNQARHEPASKSLAYFAFSKAAALALNPGDKRRALRLRQALVDAGFSTCQTRVADYYQDQDEHLGSGSDQQGPKAPDDAGFDYNASWFNTGALEDMRKWSFADVPRCTSLSTIDVIKARNAEVREILTAAFGQTGVEASTKGHVCDALDYEALFNPNATHSAGGPLGAFGEVFTNWMQLALQQRRMQNATIERLLQELVSELSSTLPPDKQEKARGQRIVLPLAPTLFARQYACRIKRKFDFGVPESFEIDNTPTIVISSAVIRHAMLSAASVSLKTTPSADKQHASQTLAKRFKMELAFLMAHEMAHAYLDHDKPRDETEIDCHAVLNLAATYGKEASLGTLGSAALAANEERLDVWRLWSAGTAKDVGQRMPLAAARLRQLALQDPLAQDCSSNFTQ